LQPQRLKHEYSVTNSLFLKKKFVKFLRKKFWRIFCQILIEFEKRIGSNRDICKFTLSLPCLCASAFTPYPLFQWYLQSNEILLKTQHLIHKVLRLTTTIVVVQVGAVKIICSSSGGAQEKRKDRMKLSLSPKSVEKLV
jgi:hypothetical protein